MKGHKEIESSTSQELERWIRAFSISQVIKSRIDLSRMSKAMEYGCGTGLLSFTLQDKFEEVTLMDESMPMIHDVDARCEREGITHFHPIQFNILTDGVPNYRFDLIYTMMRLHHINDTAFILKSFYDLLNVSGYLVIIDLVQEDGSFHNFEFDGHLGFKQKELEETMKIVGFELIDYHVCYTIQKEREGKVREYPLFMMTGRKN